MKRIHRRELFLTAAVAFMACLWGGCSKTPQQQPDSQAAAEPAAGTAKDAPPAEYVPLSHPSVRGFESSTEYSLSGKITDELLEPLPDAVVSAFGAPPRWSPPAFEQPAALATQKADEEGRYQIRLNAPANLWLNIRMEGYGSVDVFLPARDPKSTVRDFQLRSAKSTISGVVTDKKDAPIAGALVVANPPPFTLLADSLVPAPLGGVTDARGKFTIEGLPDGDVDVIASARGYAMYEQLVPLRAAQAEQANFSLAAAGPISFAVKNALGDPIPFALATSPGFIKIAGGDRQGIVEFSVSQDLSPFNCTVNADGYLPKSITIDPKAPPSTCVLEDIPSFKGRILAESGNAVDGATVSVWGTGGSQARFESSVRTDKSGRFAVPLSYPPVRELRVSAPGFLDQRLAFDGRKSPTGETVVRMKKVEAGIFGRVIDYRGIPVKRFVLHLRKDPARPAGTDFQRSYSVDSGRFAVTDVAPGVYSMIIQSVPGSSAEDVQVYRNDAVEIRQGFFLGEVIIQFPKPQFAKQETS